jgi:hypothetical protein
MNRSNAPTSLRTLARMAAFFSLFTILTGIFAQGYVSNTLVANSDAATTAANILAHKGLWQAGYAVFIIEMASNVLMVALFYRLLKPAGGSVALCAAFLGLTGCIVKTFSRLFFIAPLLVLGDAPYLSVFSAEQKQALALLFLKLNSRGAGMALAFFGLYALLNGSLVLRSTFLPKFLGVLSIIGGAGWLTFLYQPLGARLFTFIALFAIIGALAMIVWLVVFGVDEKRWYERAAAADLPPAPQAEPGVSA